MLPRLLPCLALTLAACAQPPATPPPDLGPAVASTGPDATGATVTLHGGRGPCEGEALAAIWTAAGRPSVLGCWIMIGAHGGLVQVSFLDGERADIPVGRLVRARSL